MVSKKTFFGTNKSLELKEEDQKAKLKGFTEVKKEVMSNFNSPEQLYFKLEILYGKHSKFTKTLQFYFMVASEYFLEWDTHPSIMKYSERLEGEESKELCDIQMKTWREMLNRYYKKGFLVD